MRLMSSSIRLKKDKVAWDARAFLSRMEAAADYWLICQHSPISNRNSLKGKSFVSKDKLPPSNFILIWLLLSKLMSCKLFIERLLSLVLFGLDT